MSDEINEKSEQISDQQMTVISKDLFFDGMNLPVNVYLRKKSGSYLLIGKKGDKSSFSTMHSFNNSKNQIYVRTVDSSVLFSVVAEITNKMVGSKVAIPNQVKAKFISGLAEAALEELEKTNFTSINQLQKLSKIIVQLVSNSAAFDDLAKILESYSDQESKHSMAVCFVALALCEETDVRLPAAQEKVAIASMLHDIGLRFVSNTILEKPRHLWSAEELSVYEQHPIKSVEMLRSLRDLHSDVLQIIVEHHENSQGTGFPKKIRDVKISHLGKILALANCFAGLIFDHNPEAKKYSADEAVKYIEDILGQPFNKQTFLALKNVINKKNLKDKQSS